MSNTKSKKPTNKDVAKLAGVSVATVSYVINGRTDKRISEETRKRVLHAVNFLGYVPNFHAIAINKSDMKDIAVRASKSNSILHDMEVFAILKSFTSICTAKGYTVNFSTEPTPYRVSSTACVCIDFDSREFYTLANENFVPVIAVDMLLNDPVFYQVSTDYNKIKIQADAKFANNYKYVTITPNNTRLKEEILTILPNTLFVTELDDLKNLPTDNIVVSDYILSDLLSDTIKLRFTDDKTAKLTAIIDCIEKAVNREVVPDKMHFVKI